jgi:DUF4097 and DUF4098 domain-containing protein YvlB
MKLNMRYPAVMVILLVLMVASSVVMAQEKVDQRRDVDGDARIYISNIAGEVIVTGWDKKEVRIVGTLGEGTKRLDIEGDKKRLDIEVIMKKRFRNSKGSYLEISVPNGCQLTVETVSADIEVVGLDRTIDLETVSGEIKAALKCQILECESVSGDVDLDVDTAELVVETVSGDIELNKLKCQELEVETVSGDIWVKTENLRRIEMGTVSGDLLFFGNIIDSGDFEAHSGNIEITFNGTPDAEFSVGTFSGDIDSDFGPRSGKRKSRHSRGQEVHFTSGDGKGDIEIETFSGDVHLSVK